MTESAPSFYGPDQARIHDARFGDLARRSARRLLEVLGEAGIATGTVVDLGCGSGILSRIVCDAGFDVVGVDISAPMLELARSRAPAAEFVPGSLHDFEPSPPIAGAAAIGEPLNYTTDARGGLEALESLAAKIFRALVPGGALVFDVSGPGRVGPSRHRVQFHAHDDWCLGMHAVESDDAQQLDREIVIFTETSDGRYRRVDEHHVLRLYDSASVLERLERIGFDARIEPLASANSPESGWSFFVARKPPT